jgi:hypothetical protein
MTTAWIELETPRSPGPRAPTQAEWDAMTPSEQRKAAEALPTWVPPEESGAMDGDRHAKVCASVRSALQGYFAATGQTVYVSGEIAVFFPGAVRVSPDVFVVRDAAPGPRDSWIVTREGRAPSWVLEVVVLGHRDKDLVHHPVQYAAHGIREYFVFDLRTRRLHGWRLHDPAIAMYTPIVPQFGRYRSEVLGLDLMLDGENVRLYHGTARLLDADEITEELRDHLNDEQMLRAEAEEAKLLAEQAKQQAEEAKLQAEEAKQQAEARAEREAQARATAEEELQRLRAMLALMQKP